MSFDSTGLDPRLLRALSKRGFDKPTPVQVRRRRVVSRLGGSE
jgi:superfamily II DNA/RNA helicase